MNADHYYGLAMKQLADSSTYELLETDPSEQIFSDYYNFLDRCVKVKVLDKYQYRTLTIIKCKLFTICLKYTNIHLS